LRYHCAAFFLSPPFFADDHRMVDFPSLFAARFPPLVIFSCGNLVLAGFFSKVFLGHLCFYGWFFLSFHTGLGLDWGFRFFLEFAFCTCYLVAIPTFFIFPFFNRLVVSFFHAVADD